MTLLCYPITQSHAYLEVVPAAVLDGHIVVHPQQPVLPHGQPAVSAGSQQIRILPNLHTQLQPRDHLLDSPRLRGGQPREGTPDLGNVTVGGWVMVDAVGGWWSSAYGVAGGGAGGGDGGAVAVGAGLALLQLRVEEVLVATQTPRRLPL